MTDNDFRQFKGAFDSAMEPDSVFAERLQQRMKAEAPTAPAAVRPTVIASAPARRDHAPAAQRRSHPLFIAAAVLVVFVLAIASIAQLAPRVLEPQYAAQSIATLPADVTTTPGADVMLSAEPLAELDSVSYHHPHGDNLIAVSYVPPTDAQRLVSYNLQSGDVDWEQAVSSSGHFVFGNDVIVAVSYIQPYAQDVNALPKFDDLAGYDIETGEKLWTRSIADWEMEHGWETVFLAGDTAVILLAGEIVGVNPHTGETIWRADYDLAAAQEGGWVQSPALASIDANLYLAQNNGSVEVFDLVSGAKVHEFGLPELVQDDNPVALQLFQVPAGLLVAADSYGGSDPSTTLYVIEPENGDVVWERTLAHTGAINVAADGSIAIATHTWESPPLLLRLLRQEGHSTSALTWLDADGEVILETDRVEMPNMGGLVIAGNGEYICGTIEQFACFDRTGTRYTLDIPVAWDAVWVGDTLLLVTDRGVMRVDVP